MDKTDLIVALLNNIKDTNENDHKNINKEIKELKRKLENKKTLTYKQIGAFGGVFTTFITFFIYLLDKYL